MTHVRSMGKIAQMSIEQLLAFNAALLAAIISPGPALLLAIRTTLSAGRASGIALGAGLGLMAATWTLMALLGLDVVFRLFPFAHGAAKVAGAAYLLYLAVKIWVGSRKELSQTDAAPASAFGEGILINLLNPKSVLFAAAVLIVVFPSDMSMANNLIVVVNHFVFELAFYSCLAVWLSSGHTARWYSRAKIYLDRTAAIILGGLGLRLLFGR